MLITTYLRDHHMGSAAGVDFFQRVAETHGEQEVRDVVGRLADEIEEDQAALQEILDRFDASPNPVKDVLAKVGEKAARLKPNQRLGTRSPLADVLDLEVLTDAVHAKSRGWQILLELDHPNLDREQLQQLFDRARRQEKELEALWLKQAPKLLAE
ncbi:MAG TPA: hypothetical protein GX013_06850 [Propionibacterium sp.]|nr:hypothetical protein [Propionibacterium sp.]